MAGWIALGLLAGNDLFAADWAAGWTRVAAVLPEDQFPPTDVGAISADGTLMAVAGFQGIAVSRDAGRTWTRRAFDSESPALSGYPPEGIAMSGKGELFAVTFNLGPVYQVLTSQDGGGSWKVGWETSSDSVVVRRPAVAVARDSGRLFVVEGDQLYSSDVIQGPWTRSRLPSGPNLFQYEEGGYRLLSASADGQKLVAACQIPPICVVSEDGGTRWSRLVWPTNAPSPTFVRGMGMSGDGRHLVISINTASDDPAQFGVLVSDDGGLNWRYLPLPPKGNGMSSPVAISDDGRRILVAARSDQQPWGEPEESLFFFEEGGPALPTAVSNMPVSWIAMSADGGVQFLGSPRSGGGWTWTELWANGVEYPPTAREPTRDGDLQLVGDRTVWFEVEASGGRLSYQWRRDGVDLVDGGGKAGTRTAVLVLSPATREDLGRYTVQISNTAGSIEVNAGVLQPELSVPVIVSHQQTGSEAFVEGARLQFEVVAKGGLLDFQWRRNGVDVLDSAGVHGSQSPSLIIDSCSPEHLGEYSVVVRNPLGTLEQVVGRVGYTLPRVVGFRQVGGPAVNLGDAVRFEVWAEGGGLTLQWMKDGLPIGSIEPFRGGVTNTLALAAVRLADLGRYSGVISNRLGVIETSTFHVHLATWESVGSILGEGERQSLSVSQDGTRLLVLSGSSVRHSEDGGRNWSEVRLPGSGFVTARVLEPRGHWLLVRSQGPPNLVRTSDSGRTWQELTDWESARWDLAGFGVSEDGSVMLLNHRRTESMGFWDFETGLVRLSRDGGQSWSSVPGTGGLSRWGRAAVVSRTGQVVAFIQHEYTGQSPNYWTTFIYRSEDRGTNWVREVLPPWSKALVMTPGGEQLFCIADGVLLARSGPNGFWKPLPISGLLPVPPAVSEDGQRIHVVRSIPGSTLGEIVQSSDGGRTWRWSGSLAARWTELGGSGDGLAVYGISDRGLFHAPSFESRLAGQQIAQALSSPSGIRMEWNTEPHRTYRLFHSRQLKPGTWTSDGALVADAEGKVVLEVPTDAPQAFWQLSE